MRVVAVIPCYNEEKMIADVVTRAKKQVDKVIVADDCSMDGTSLLAKKAGALVAESPYQRGFGRNVRWGLEVAMSDGKTDIIVTLDGDGQHNPDEIPRVVEMVQNREADLVIGSRFLEKFSCPRYRKIGIDIITWLYNIGCGQKISDSQSCFRAYSRELLEVLTLEDDTFGFSTEILIKARKQGFSIREAPISCIYHKDFKINSSMNPILQGLIVCLATIKWRMWKYKR